MNKNRMQSSIFGAPDGQRNGAETPRRNGQGNDSHNRLFGDVERPYTPAKNHMKSNLPIGDTTDANGKANGHHQNGNGNGTATKTNGHHQNGNGVSSATNGHSHSNGHSNGHHSNGHSNGSATSSAPSQNGSSHKIGNPVTGEGYKSGGAAEINTTVPSLNGAGNVINKNRIPPGGFSSGLW